MTPKNAFWKWSLLGGLTAIVLLVGQAMSVGGLDGLLQVGETSELRPIVEQELGEIPLAPRIGHDGHLFYVIGTDLLGERVTDDVEYPGYRYRRILFPAIASGFGLLDGDALLVGMVVVIVLSAAVAAGSVAASARLLGSSDWIALAVVLNPGVWLSVRLLTADVVAIALMTLGILGYLTRPRLGIAAFTLSVLTKEPYLLTPAGLSVSRDRRRWLYTIVPVAALLAWTSWIALTIGGDVTGETGNLTLPFVGIVEGSAWWPDLAAADRLYLTFAMASTIGALLLGLFRRSWLRWSLLVWGILGICASAWVWRFGNNIARAVAPIAILAALSLATSKIDPRGDRRQPTISRRNLPV